MNNSMSVEQIMFYLAISSNAGSSIKGTGIGVKVYNAIKKQIDALNEKTDDNWEIVWGPGIYQHKTGGLLDNVMFAAFNPSFQGNPTYYVSVAGTNPSSMFDWIKEDLDVSTTVQWPYNSSVDAQISNGISKGLGELVSMKPEKGVPGEGITLDTYLSNNTSEYDSYTIITGGHSLGGALSPLVALWLKDTQSSWNKGGKTIDYQCWPSAGQTPGLDNFTNYYNSSIPNTHRIFNSLDVVPHAFNRETLNQAKSLYAPEISSLSVDLLIGSILNKVGSLNYTQLANEDYKLNGKLNKSIISNSALPVYNYSVQMIYQHVKAYFELLDVDYNDVVSIQNQEETVQSIFSHLESVAAEQQS